MAFTQTLTEYVNNNPDLIAKIVLKAESAQYMTKMPKIKYKQRINYLATDAALTAAGGCGWSPSGTTTLTEKDIIVYNLKMQEALCPTDLVKYVEQLAFNYQGHETNIPFEKIYIDQKSKEISRAIELMLWSSTGNTTNTLLGLKYQADVDSTVVDNTFVWSGSTYTFAQYQTQVNTMINALPVPVQSLDNLRLFCSYTTARKILNAIGTANLFAMTGLGNADGNHDFLFPYTNIKITPVNGISVNTFTLLTHADNLIYGFDLSDESDNIQVRYIDYDETVHVSAYMKVGVSYYFGENIVLSQ